MLQITSLNMHDVYVSDSIQDDDNGFSWCLQWMGFTDEHKTFRLTVLIGDPSQDISVRLFASTVTSTLQLIFSSLWFLDQTFGILLHFAVNDRVPLSCMCYSVMAQGGMDKYTHCFQSLLVQKAEWIKLWTYCILFYIKYIAWNLFTSYIYKLHAYSLMMSGMCVLGSLWILWF